MLKTCPNIPAMYTMVPPCMMILRPKRFVKTAQNKHPKTAPAVAMATIQPFVLSY